MFFKSNPYAILIAAVVIYFFIKRIWNNYSSKKASLNISKKIEEDADFALNFSDELDILVSKEESTIKAQLKNKLKLFSSKNYPNLKHFQIKSCVKINEDQYLLVVLAEYKDLSGNNRRSPTEVTHFLDLYFKIYFNSPEDKIYIYSNLYESNIDKNLRKEFVNELLSIL